MSQTPSRNSRSDARTNRAHLVAVARTTFAEEGLNVTTREIARRARLGAATVYRHFPSRADLVTAAFRQQVADCTAAVADALADPDPWRGLSRVIEEIGGRQALDRAFVSALLTDTTVFAAERARNAAAFRKIVARARAAGVLRPDFTVADLRILLTATTGLTASRPDRRLTDVRRLTTLLLEGLRAHPRA
jgi:AcrR family transcriptional regulator